jgi:hypothetical protein
MFRFILHDVAVIKNKTMKFSTENSLINYFVLLAQLAGLLVVPFEASFGAALATSGSNSQCTIAHCMSLCRLTKGFRL